MSDKPKEPADKKPTAPKVCGIVMPISAIDNCSEVHWSDVRAILSSAIADAGFTPNLVSNSDDSGIIQKRIIQNLYENPIVVCDVSGKNPNVMFELGMRLAFDRPTIVVKDDKTSYSFDTSPIEHLAYPRDLRFASIVDFKQNLKLKIEATSRESESNPGYSTFLKHFGQFTVAKLDTKEVSKDQFILEELRRIGQVVDGLTSNLRQPLISPLTPGRMPRFIYVSNSSEAECGAIASIAFSRGLISRMPPIIKDIKGRFRIPVPLDLEKASQILDIAKEINSTSRLSVVLADEP